MRRARPAPASLPVPDLSTYEQNRGSHSPTRAIDDKRRAHRRWQGTQHGAERTLEALASRLLRFPRAISSIRADTRFGERPVPPLSPSRRPSSNRTEHTAASATAARCSEARRVSSLSLIGGFEPPSASLNRCPRNFEAIYELTDRPHAVGEQEQRTHTASFAHSHAARMTAHEATSESLFAASRVEPFNSVGSAGGTFVQKGTHQSPSD